MPIVVRFAPDSPESVRELGELPIHLKDGIVRPLSSLGSISPQSASGGIRRVDGRRVVTLSVMIAPDASRQEVRREAQRVFDDGMPSGVEFTWRDDFDHAKK